MNRDRNPILDFSENLSRGTISLKIIVAFLGTSLVVMGQVIVWVDQWGIFGVILTGVGTLVLAVLGFLGNIFSSYGALRLVKSLKEIEGRYADLKENADHEKLKISHVEAFNWLLETCAEILNNALNESSNSEGSNNDAYMKIAGAMSDKKSQLFGVEEDHFTISIYKPELTDNGQPTDELYCVGYYRPANHDRLVKFKPPRVWTKGVGYIGKAYETCRVVEIYDTESASELRSVMERNYEVDDDLYRSVITVPITLGLNKPLGALIITSSIPNRFSKADERPRKILLCVAKLLAVYIFMHQNLK